MSPAWSIVCQLVIMANAVWLAVELVRLVGDGYD